MNLPIPLGFSRAHRGVGGVVRGRATANRARRWRVAMAAGLLLAAAPSSGEPPAASEPVQSERVVPEEEWAGDLVELLAIDAALPDSPQPADYFSLLCAEQAERELGAGGRSAPIGPLFEASAE